MKESAKYNLEFFDQYIDYIPEKARFKWKKREPIPGEFSGSTKRWNTKYSGKIAGGVFRTGKDKRLKFAIFGKHFCNYRVVAIFHGIINDYDSPYLIDHIDGNTLNDHPKNLRAVDKKINGRNCKMRTENKSGVTGVSRHSVNDAWIVTMGIHGTDTWRWSSERDFFEAVCLRRSWELEAGYTKRHFAPLP